MISMTNKPLRFIDASLQGVIMDSDSGETHHALMVTAKVSHVTPSDFVAHGVANAVDAVLDTDSDLNKIAIQVSRNGDQYATVQIEDLHGSGPVFEDKKIYLKGTVNVDCNGTGTLKFSVTLPIEKVALVSSVIGSDLRLSLDVSFDPFQQEIALDDEIPAAEHLQ